MTDWKDIFRKMLAKGGYLLRRASVVERNEQWARESLALARQGCPASIASVVFSCDRAMQLEAFLRSYREKVAHAGQMYVLYRASDEGHARSYRELRQEMAASSLAGRLTWVEERDFRAQLLDILEQCPCRTVALYVDDMLFLHPIDYDVLKEVDTTRYIPSICRGRDMRYSAVLGRPIDLPDLTASPYPPLLAFRWNQYRELSDWTYPLGVSGYFYGRDELLALCRRIDFRHPNSLESAMQAYKDVLPPGWACAMKKLPVAVSTPTGYRPRWPMPIWAISLWQSCWNAGKRPSASICVPSTACPAPRPGT